MAIALTIHVVEDTDRHRFTERLTNLRAAGWSIIGYAVIPASEVGAGRLYHTYSALLEQR